MSTGPYVKFAGRYADQDYVHEQTCGYSCQTWLARLLNNELHKGTYFCWFSKDFNAFENGDDSNPIWLYLQIDRAVKQGASNHSKIKDIRTNLMRAAVSELTKANREGEIQGVVRAIADAPLTWLHPEIWRLKLKSIEGRYTSNHQYKDEFNIVDLKTDEFELIIQ